METSTQLIQQRELILRQIQSLGPMRMGTVREQYLPVRRADGSVGRRGPYLTYTYKHEGRTRGRHLRNSEQAELYRGQIENWRRYQELSARLVRISQRLADLEAQEAEEAGQGKKNSGRRSRPSARPKRRG